MKRNQALPLNFAVMLFSSFVCWVFNFFFFRVAKNRTPAFECSPKSVDIQEFWLSETKIFCTFERFMHTCDVPILLLCKCFRLQAQQTGKMLENFDRRNKAKKKKMKWKKTKRINLCCRRGRCSQRRLCVRGVWAWAVVDAVACIRNIWTVSLCASRASFVAIKTHVLLVRRASDIGERNFVSFCRGPTLVSDAMPMDAKQRRAV